MSDVNISNDADVLICLIYKYYLELRGTGISKSDAKSLGSSEDIHENIIPEWSFEDVDDTCRELHTKNLLSVIYGDDICYKVDLTDDGIVYMENRFGNKIKTVLDYLSKIKLW